MKRKFVATRYPAPDMRPPPLLGEAKKFTPKGETGRDGSKRDVPRPLTKAVALSPEAKAIVEVVDALQDSLDEYRTQVGAQLMVLKTQAGNELERLKARVDALESQKVLRRTTVTKFKRNSRGAAEGATAVSDYEYSKGES